MRKLKVTAFVQIRDAERKMLIGRGFQDDDGTMRVYLDVAPPHSRLDIVPEELEPITEHAVFTPLAKALVAIGPRVKEVREILFQIPGFEDWIRRNKQDAKV